MMTLPATPNVAKIIDDFHQRNPDLEAETKAVVNDLVTLFEIELGRSLIYREERYQYKAVLENLGKGDSITSTYGAFHFLRLFVKLPVLLNQLSDRLGEDEIAKIISVSSLLTKFLETHQGLFFSERYEPNPHIPVVTE